MCHGTCVVVRGQFAGIRFFFSAPMGFNDQTQLSRLGGKWPYTVSHLTTLPFCETGFQINTADLNQTHHVAEIGLTPSRPSLLVIGMQIWPITFRFHFLKLQIPLSSSRPLRGSGPIDLLGQGFGSREPLFILRASVELFLTKFEVFSQPEPITGTWAKTTAIYASLSR